MKVACIDCEHCKYKESHVILHGGDKGEFAKCWVGCITGWNPVTGLTYVKPEYCKHRNRKGDCEDFVQKQPTVQEYPWWKFWRK